MIRYALTIFWSAFLLFLVQPMLGKRILPWFGGTPAVWTTCLLFFQTLLLAGYIYAHGITAWLKPRAGALLHVALLGGSLFLVPIVADPGYRSQVESSPTWQILALLTFTVGAPYFLISSTGPLVQAWFSQTHSGSPYRLYALSNVGSLAALLSYPFVVEPRIMLGDQMRLWSWGYAAFAAASALCAWQVTRHIRGSNTVEVQESATGNDASHASGASDSNGQTPDWRTLLLWLGLAGCGSAMLMATTNQICQEVAIVPFLWILPLTLYLLSFIICFDSPRWYDRRIFMSLLALCAPVAAAVLLVGVSTPILVQLGTYIVTLFACTMACHGELVRARPAPRHLTLFYLCIAGGGALGGAFVALVAPAVFTGFWEYHLALVGCCMLSAIAVLQDTQVEISPRARRLISATLVVAFGGLISALAIQAIHFRKDAVVATRNFYGVLRVLDNDFDTDLGIKLRMLVHGAIWHGSQILDDEMRRWPTSYYARDSGVGLAITRHPRRFDTFFADDVSRSRLRIGAIGLGVGTVASLGERGDAVRFYEINPEVLRIASDYFFYLSDTEADCQVALGDARRTLETELAAHGSQQFDVLVMDAFSSDAIPMHLLTTECVDLYWKHLRADGVLAVNISNRNLDLIPVVKAMAESAGKQVRLCDTKGNDNRALLHASWALITGNQEFLDDVKVTELVKEVPDNVAPLAWTDDYGSLWHVLRPIVTKEWWPKKFWNPE